MLLDFSRQRVTLKTMDMLFGNKYSLCFTLPSFFCSLQIHPFFSDLAETANVRGKIKAFASGEKVNLTEGRAAGHMALRACADSKVLPDALCCRFRTTHFPLFWSLDNYR